MNHEQIIAAFKEIGEWYKPRAKEQGKADPKRLAKVREDLKEIQKHYEK